MTDAGSPSDTLDLTRDDATTTETGGPDSSPFTVPGIDKARGIDVASILQDRLRAMIDLALTLKHIHWNVVGPTFIGVHEMLDPQHESAQDMVDEIAERIAALGGSPDGRPGSLVAQRRWDDYGVERALVPDHLRALDSVYDGVLIDHRRAIADLEDLDIVSHDLLVNHVALMEKYQWFVRAHLGSGLPSSTA